MQQPLSYPQRVPLSAAVIVYLSWQVLVLAIFFNKSSSTPGIDAAGLLSAVAGLVLFLEGLRVAIMPMALLVGNQLPLKLKLPGVLLVAFFLGVVSVAALGAFQGSCKLQPTSHSRLCCGCACCLANQAKLMLRKLPGVLLVAFFLGVVSVAAASAFDGAFCSARH
jgi:hypothetical protein